MTTATLPALRRLHALGTPSILVPNLPCGCDGGYEVTRYAVGFYGDSWRESLTPCQQCEGNSFVELRAIPNGPRWAEDYGEFVGGFFVLISGRELKLGWSRTEAEARAGHLWEDWTPGFDDASLLAAMGVPSP